MKANLKKRIIYWNMRVENAPENVCTWYFLIVNERKMVAKIQDRIFQELQPANETRDYRRTTLKGEDLRVLCFSLESPKPKLDFRKVYDGKWRREQELYYRPGIESLIERLIS